jgi:hypothetical protein
MSLLIPEHILKNGPWSISKAQTAEKCSQQFAYKYGPNKQKEITVFEQSRVGTAVHKALELALQGTPLKQAFMIAADEGELTQNESEQLYARWDQVARYVKFTTEFKKQHGCKEELFERRWGIKADGTKCEFFAKDVFFRGVVDHGILTNNNDLVIFDHKSGKEKDLSYYDPQFRGYCLMSIAQIPNLRGVQTAINFVMPDVLRWNKFIWAKDIQSSYLEWLVTFLTKSCEKLLEPPATITNKREKWKCDWCGYRTICSGPFAGEDSRGKQENGK